VDCVANFNCIHLREVKIKMTYTSITKLPFHLLFARSRWISLPGERPVFETLSMNEGAILRDELVILKNINDKKAPLVIMTYHRSGAGILNKLKSMQCVPHKCVMCGAEYIKLGGFDEIYISTLHHVEDNTYVFDGIMCNDGKTIIELIGEKNERLCSSCEDTAEKNFRDAVINLRYLKNLRGLPLGEFKEKSNALVKRACSLCRLLFAEHCNNCDVMHYMAYFGVSFD